MYLLNLLTELKPQRERMRSSNKGHLLIPKTKCKTFAVHSFSVASLTLWNKLPEEIKNPNYLLTFKKQLKTHLFKLVDSL